MLFHPDAGRSIEEIIEDTWRRMPQAAKDRYQAVAESRGLTVMELINERLEEIVDELEEKVRLGTLTAELDFREMPFGPDPRLHTDGAR